MPVSECAEWYYEPDFSELPGKDFDAAILDREITEDEFHFLARYVKAYTLFVEGSPPKRRRHTAAHHKKTGKASLRRSAENAFKGGAAKFFPQTLRRKDEAVERFRGPGISRKRFLERI